MTELSQDLRFATRTLVRNRGFAAVAIVCIAVGVGVNTAVFSIVNGLLFRPLPYPDADRIVLLEAVHAGRGIEDAGVAHADLEDLRALDGIEGAEGFMPRSVTLTAGDQPARLQASSVTPGLFRLLGVPPALGRGFFDDEAAVLGFEQVVILGDDLWRSSFGADPGIIGRAVHLNGRELTVVGVMPPGFRFPDADDLWLPLGSQDPTGRRGRYVNAVGRLAEGTSLEAAAARLDVLADRLEAEHPATHTGWGLRAQTLRDAMVGSRARQLMYVMLGAVTLVLLIACANVANLVLARSADRERELAIRRALGAGRHRLIRQLLTESLVLALAGGVLGILLAAWCVDAVLAVVPSDAYAMREELASWMQIQLDGRVLLYALGLSLGTGLVFGLLPAFHAAGPHLRLSSARGGTGADPATERVRNVLVTAEIALSVMLLIGSALLVQSFLRLQSADAGFDGAQVLSLRIVLAGDQYDPNEAKAAYFRTAAERLGALPGAVSSAATSAIPADDGGGTLAILSEGDARSWEDATVATVIASTDGLFRTLGVRLLAGRDFTAGEVADTTRRVAILGETLARELWPDGEAVGRRFRPVTSDAAWFTVVGVAPDLKYEEFGEDSEQTRRQIHVPYAHSGDRAMAFLIRARGNPEELIPAVRDELRAVDGTLAPYDAMGLGRRRAVTTWSERMFGQTFAGFGAAALLLAMAGVYGVMAYAVARRRREIGVRLALGATGAGILRMVVGRAARLTGVGLLVGLAGGLILGRLLSGSLWGVHAADPATFAAVPIFLGATALVAAWIPARRAARIQPVDAIRDE